MYVFLFDFLELQQYTSFDMGQIKGTFNTAAELNNTLQSLITLKKNSVIEIDHYSGVAHALVVICEDQTIKSCTIFGLKAEVKDTGYNALFATMLWPHGEFVYETKNEKPSGDALADERQLQKLAMGSMTILRKHVDYYEQNTYVTFSINQNSDINQTLLFSVTQIKNNMKSEAIRYRDFIKMFNPVCYDQFEILKTIIDAGILIPADDTLIQNEKLFTASLVLKEKYEKASDVIKSGSDDFTKIENLYIIVIDYIKKQYIDSEKTSNDTLEAIIAEGSLECDTPLFADVSAQEFKFTKGALRNKDLSDIQNGYRFLIYIIKEIEQRVGFMSENEWIELFGSVKVT